MVQDVKQLKGQVTWCIYGWVAVEENQKVKIV